LDFEWDRRKARLNAAKHGVTFEEATTVFEDPLTSTVPDDRFEEQRFLTIGRSRRGKMIVVAHADRGNSTLRIISARLATRRERKQYEQS